MRRANFFWYEQKMICLNGHLTYLTSPKSEGISAVMAPPKRGVCLKVVAMVGCR